MFDGLIVVSLISTCYQLIKEKLEPTIPAENWANRELYYQDVTNGVPIEQRMKNLENGKYKLASVGQEAVYPEPHRDTVSGKIVIENCTLYNEDVRKYGAYQAQQWVNQGKYNLTPQELEKERRKYQQRLERLYGVPVKT